MDPMTTPDTPLSPGQLTRLKGHLMTEITASPTHFVASPPVRRWTPRRLGVAGAVVAVATAGLLTGLTAFSGPGGLGPTAFAVTPQPHGKVAIGVISTQASADQMTRQLHQRGINISIETVPVTPQLVGRWLSAGSSEGVPAKVNNAISSQISSNERVSTIVVPARFSGQISLTIGRAPQNGEQIAVGGLTNQLAPGGAFACDSFIGKDPTAVAADLQSRGYTVSYSTGLYGSPTPTPEPGGKVTDAWLLDLSPTNAAQAVTDPHQVVLSVTRPTDPEYDTKATFGFPPTALHDGHPQTSPCGPAN